jgi:transposase InsO family protein
MQLAVEEYDRLQTNTRGPKQTKSDTGVALSAQNTSNTGGKSGSKSPRMAKNGKPYGVCWNCGGKGHVASQCPSPPNQSSTSGTDKGKKKEDTSNRTSGGSAHAAVSSEEDGVWSAFDPADLYDDVSVTNSTTTMSDGSVESLFDISWDHIPSYLSAATTVSDESDNWADMPSLQTVSNTVSESDSLPSGNASEQEGNDDSDDGSDSFSEVGDDGLSDDFSAEVDFATAIADISDADEGAFVSLLTEVVQPAGRVDLYDSGTTEHLTPYRDQFSTYRDITPKSFTAANRQKFHAVGSGDMFIDVPDGLDVSKMKLTEVLYSPEIGYTLISVGRLDSQGFTATFGDGKCEITHSDDGHVGTIPRSEKGLYRVIHESIEPLSDDEANVATTHLTSVEFHRRMGHISPTVAKRLITHGFVTGVSLDTSSDEPVFCEACTFAKSRRQAIPKVREGERATVFGGEIHSDVWGPAPVQTIGGRRYFVSFTDDYSRLTHIYLLRRKSETFGAYKTFEAWTNTQLNTKIKVLHSDRGGEYMSEEFTKYLAEHGTEQKLTVHDTPEENGVAEVLNRVVTERMRAILHASGLPKFLWGEAVRHVIWLKNRTSTVAVASKTPHEVVTGKKPNLSMLPEWGCPVWVHTKDNSKLDARAIEGRWVGFDEQSKGSRIYWPEKHSITVERSLTFTKPLAVVDELEGENHEEPESRVKLSAPPNQRTPGNKPEVSAPEEPRTPPRMSSGLPPVPEAPRIQRIRKPSRYVRDIREGEGSATGLGKQPSLPVGLQLPESRATIEEVSEENEEEREEEREEGITMVVDAGDIEPLEPKSLAEARRRPEWPEWEKGIRDEIKTLEDAGTWELTNLPNGANLVGSKWVFRIKKDATGRVVRYKAQLVAQGFSQVEGVDYFDTYAPVARLSSIRTILALAARLNLELHQIDIKGAYLNGVLTDNEVIYMRQPPGYPYPNSGGQVLRLQKTIYGLKQSGRRWYQRLTDICRETMGLTRCNVDQAVFYRRDANSLIVMAVHVDDCTIAARPAEVVIELKEKLGTRVEVTDLGELHWLLGIEIARDRDARTIRLTQRQYIDDIIRRYGCHNERPLSLPMGTNMRLSSDQSPKTPEDIAAMRNIPYRQAIGSLMYASLATRPDITFAVTRLSKFLQNPGPAHWEAARNIFRYLKGTHTHWLVFGEHEEILAGWVDADGSQEEDRHAITGYAFLMDGGAVSWNSKQQEIIVLSTTEGEYVAATQAAKEALWLRSFTNEVFGLELAPTTLFSDNKSAIALSKDHQYHARTKHIDIRFHFIRWIIENGSIRLIYCPTEDMLADTLTKPLPSTKAKHFASELGLRAT